MKKKSDIKNILESNYPEEPLSYFWPYLKKFFLYFFLPFWASVIINDGAVLVKIIYWFSQEIEFLEIREYVSMSLLVAAFPLAYLFWFYRLVIKKTLLQLYDDFLINLNGQLGLFMAEALIERKNSKIKDGWDIGDISNLINEKIAKFPAILRWLCRKILDQIPFVELLNGFESKDVEEGNVESIARGLTDKLNAMSQEIIGRSIPRWVVLIIPINLILLLYYIWM